jgi:mRNA interferase HigB
LRKSIRRQKADWQIGIVYSKGTIRRILVELRRIFPHADQVDRLTVFNIGGNKARLIAAVHYNRRKVYIRAVLAHAEYDAGKWKEK